MRQEQRHIYLMKLEWKLEVHISQMKAVGTEKELPQKV